MRWLQSAGALLLSRMLAQHGLESLFLSASASTRIGFCFTVFYLLHPSLVFLFSSVSALLPSRFHLLASFPRFFHSSLRPFFFRPFILSSFSPLLPLLFFIFIFHLMLIFPCLHHHLDSEFLKKSRWFALSRRFVYVTCMVTVARMKPYALAKIVYCFCFSFVL